MDVFWTVPWGCRGCKSNQYRVVAVSWLEPYLRVWQSVVSCSVSAALASTTQAALYCPRWLVSVPRSHLQLSHPDIQAHRCFSSSSHIPSVQRGCWGIGNGAFIKCTHCSFSTVYICFMFMFWLHIKKSFLHLYLTQQSGLTCIQTSVTFGLWLWVPCEQASCTRSCNRWQLGHHGNSKHSLKMDAWQQE